ncbi:hypothetical protein SNK03_010359 [Fusarium graminearum]
MSEVSPQFGKTARRNGIGVWLSSWILVGNPNTSSNVNVGSLGRLDDRLAQLKSEDFSSCLPGIKRELFTFPGYRRTLTAKSAMGGFGE